LTSPGYVTNALNPGCATDEVSDSGYFWAVDASLRYPDSMQADGMQQIGPYTITRELGRGGMGVVYLARDSRLDRDVAIKALPEHLANDPDRLARFQREAKVLASLNHPSIGAIYGIEEANGQHYLVLEFIDGQTLNEMLSRGSLPIHDAIEIAVKIAEALEVAHEKGVIHRDLKPGNIMVTADGAVKVLDFGLARTTEATSSMFANDDSPTMTSPMPVHSPTIPGAIMGTAGYMSPEQARGKPVDKRSDIFSFGCVLYEMLTGAQPFRGETVADSIGATLHKELDLALLPEGTSLSVRDLLRRMLEKNARRRQRDIGDARLILEEAVGTHGWSGAGSSVEKKPRRTLTVLALIASLFLIVLGVVAGYLIGGGTHQTTGEPIVRRFTISLPGDLRLVPGPGLNPVAISPDGKYLAYCAGTVAGDLSVYFRELDSLNERTISGRGLAPFFTPDSGSIGWWTDPQLYMQSLTGGPISEVLSPGTRLGQCAITADGRAVFTPDWGRELWIVSNLTGEGRPLTKLATQDGERMHHLPHVLPDDDAVLFTIWTGSTFDDAWIGIADMETGEHRVLLRNGTSPQYASSGHLLYARGDTLMARRFDHETKTITGPAVPALEGVAASRNGGKSYYSVARDGTLVYVPGTVGDPTPRQVVVSRTAEMIHEFAELENAFIRGFTADGRQAIVELTGPVYQIGVLDVASGVITRLTFSGDNEKPILNADDTEVTFASNADGEYALYSMPIDGSALPRKLDADGARPYPSSWSPDGKYLAYFAFNESGQPEHRLYSPGEQPPSRTLLANTSHARISPDGRWIVYETQEREGAEVYVQALPGPGGRWQVSIGGGANPFWTADGSEIIYMNEFTVYSRSVTAVGAVLRLGAPKMLFELPHLWQIRPAPDGNILVHQHDGSSLPREFVVVLNWFEELKQKAPATRH
jgi:eukaryotic-like serine/threonine-protein kinase